MRCFCDYVLQCYVKYTTHALAICMHAWLQFYGSVQFPMCYLLSADSRIDTIRGYMC